MQPTSVAACLHYNWYNECHFVQFRGDNTVSSLFWFPTHLKMCGFDTIISLFSHIFVPFYCDFLSFFFFFLLLSLLSWWIYLCATNGIGSPNTQQVLPCVIGAVGKKIQQHIYHCSAAAAAEFSAGIWQKNNNFSVQQWSIVRCFLNQEPASQTLGISFQGMLSSLMKW